MQVQHVRGGDGRAEKVVYTYQLSRGHSEERNYGGLRLFQAFLNCLIYSMVV